MKITTKSGFKVDLNENIIRDWRFITTTAKIHRSDDELEIIELVNDILNYILGEVTTQKLLKHIAKKHGVADVKVVIEEYGDIITQLEAQVKKSPSSSV